MTLLALTLVAFGLAVRVARMDVSVVPAVVLVLALVAVDVAAAVNASYRYLPTLGVALDGVPRGEPRAGASQGSAGRGPGRDGEAPAAPS